MRFIRMRKATMLGLVAALCLVCALPGAAAMTATDDDAPSWGTRLVEHLLETAADWFAFDGKGNDVSGDGDDGGIEGSLDEPAAQSNECPPGNPAACEGGPDWDPNG